MVFAKCGLMYQSQTPIIFTRKNTFFSQFHYLRKKKSVLLGSELNQNLGTPRTS